MLSRNTAVLSAIVGDEYDVYEVIKLQPKYDKLKVGTRPLLYPTLKIKTMHASELFLNLPIHHAFVWTGPTLKVTTNSFKYCGIDSPGKKKTLTMNMYHIEFMLVNWMMETSTTARKNNNK